MQCVGSKVLLHMEKSKYHEDTPEIQWTHRVWNVHVGDTAALESDLQTRRWTIFRYLRSYVVAHAAAFHAPSCSQTLLGSKN